MSDDIDRANDTAEFNLNMALANHRQTHAETAESADWCEACGGEIPEARRKAVPGVQLCIYCANEEERRSHRFRTDCDTSIIHGSRARLMR